MPIRWCLVRTVQEKGLEKERSGHSNKGSHRHSKKSPKENTEKEERRGIRKEHLREDKGRKVIQRELWRLKDQWSPKRIKVMKTSFDMEATVNSGNCCKEVL